MKTSGIHFCYKRQSDYSHEQVNIHVNASRKTASVQIVKNHRMRHIFKHMWQPSGGHLDVVWREIPKFKTSILKTAAAIELKTFNKIYIKDV